MQRENLRILGGRIRRARHLAGMTQRQLGEQVQMSRGSIGNVECGAQQVSLEKLLLIGQVLGVDAAGLLRGLPEHAGEDLAA